MPVVTEAERAHVADLVKRHLGFDALREGQAETMARVLRGEDVLAIMPTGGGKSICYQLPGALTPGVTLVVSPLIALMKDQLDAMLRRDAPSGNAMRAVSLALTSEMPPDSQRRALDDISEGRYRLVYVAPERLRQASLLRALRRARVARLVVDEAHCVSMWGHDFRPDYLALPDARRALGNPPVLAMTATAPPRVERDIQARLGPLEVVRASIARPNLRFEAELCKDADDKLARLYALCRETPGPGVVYAASRAKCEQLAAALSSAGVDAEPYHAGLPDRGERQERFMDGRTGVLVATVAFGMGVDKSDIRFVFHHDPSSSLENYYQEAGRAGRDGAPARCVVLATGQDGGSLKTRAKSDLPSRDLISHVWAGVLARKAEGAEFAVVPVEDLEDLAQERDDPKPRVALSILHEAGALARLADVPARIRTRGRADVPMEGDVLSLAPALGVAPEDVEQALLDAEERGAMQHVTSGRAHLVRVHGDTSRVEEVLERYERTSLERADEMMAYVRARKCRAAQLLAHFHEAAPERCGNCDLCLGIAHEAADIPGGDDETAARAVLAALGGVRGIGQQNLVWMLRGDARAPEWAMGRAGFGALAFRSEARVRAVVEEVERRGFLARESLPHGGVTLQLTQAGAAALHSGAPVLPPRVPSPVPALGRAPARSEAPASAPAEAPADEEPLDASAQARFERLKAWRRQRADEELVPPYVVAHDRTLRAIARAAPTTADELLRVKGMGPKRVEKHGPDILRVLQG